MPVLFGIVIFTVYDATHSTKLSVAQIYSLITLFNQLGTPVRFYLMALLNRADGKAAALRIQSLFDIEPIEPLKDDLTIPKGTLEIKGGNFNYVDPKYYELFEKK
jgi:ABC-type multidrug transport system fused ATPase/permease subunit